MGVSVKQNAIRKAEWYESGEFCPSSWKNAPLPPTDWNTGDSTSSCQPLPFPPMLAARGARSLPLSSMEGGPTASPPGAPAGGGCTALPPAEGEQRHTGAQRRPPKWGAGSTRAGTQAGWLSATFPAPRPVLACSGRPTNTRSMSEQSDGQWGLRCYGEMIAASGGQVSHCLLNLKPARARDRGRICSSPRKLSQLGFYASVPHAHPRQGRTDLPGTT